MKRRNFVAFLALVLVVALIFTLAACKNNGEETDPPGGGNANHPGETEEPTPPTADDLKKDPAGDDLDWGN